MSQLLTLPHTLPLLDNEFWWGGRNADGTLMPLGSTSRHRVCLADDLRSNQGAPFLVSSAGRYLWCDLPFTYEIADGAITLTGTTAKIQLSDGHGTLAGAFREASRAHFPALGKTPPEEFFRLPQYNTWIELNHNQTQSGILDYARSLLDSGFPPGVLMIDAGWAPYWGKFDFDAARFPDPRAMVAQLKSWGFRVMLWVCPFISPDSAEFRRWRDQTGWLLRDRTRKPCILEWWDGHSAHLDLTDPNAMGWLRGELRRLQSDTGFDGFKFDAGDTAHFIQRPASVLQASPVELTESWARLGLEFPFNEYRACWKMGGQPLVQRLHDRTASWDESGLESLIPNGIAQGLIGHPFICPDMVGGGEYMYFKRPDFAPDQELFIRSAQASALFPMMQFSSLPSRVLSPENLARCLAAVEVHRAHAEEIIALAHASATTGEPILRPLEWSFPHLGYHSVTDQFLLGDNLMVAPVLSPGAASRRVFIPPGIWCDDLEHTVEGPKEIETPVDLNRLPRWRRQSLPTF
jgi:alpha-glucosidase (family GH31 glycosyl hydrolase)